MTEEPNDARRLCESDGEGTSSIPRVNLLLSDFDIVQSLGEGSFSEVIQANLRSTGEAFALKIVDKRLALRHNKIKSLKLERSLLERLHHPGIVGFYYTFQDQASLYFGLELCPNGELFDQIQRRGKLSVESARFYAAEVLQILIYLREQQVVHGDLKPENLLLTETGHLKLIDFGSALDFAAAPEGYRENEDTLQGTADYTAPEAEACKTLNEHVRPSTRDKGLREALTGGKGVSYEADLWAFGCIIYQMLEGKPPFKAGSEYLTFEKILALDYCLPDHFPEAAKDIVRSLLMIDHTTRLGAADLQQLQDHEFFHGTIWSKLWSSPAPELMKKPSEGNAEEEIDWRLSSLALSQPLRYEYDDNCRLGSVSNA